MSTVTPTATPQASSRRTVRARWLAVITVALCTFAVVTAEQLPVGVLPAIANDLRVSTGLAGLVVTVTGVTAGLAAPLIPLVAGRLDRRWVLAGLMLTLVVAHVVAGIAPTFVILLASRVLVGIAIGGFWAFAGSMAMRLVPEHAVPRATALIFGGVAVANVLGVPAGTLLGGLLGWRVAFAALGGFGLLVLTGVLVLLPHLPAAEPVRVRMLATQLRSRRVRAVVLATFLFVTGQFAAFTFVRPVLESVSGIDTGLIGVLLLGYGATGIIGNFLAGSAAARYLRPTILIITATLATTLALFPLLGSSAIGGVTLLLLWGFAFGAAPVSLQTWVLKTAPQAPEATSALWVSMFNFSIAIGALLGGSIVDTVGLSIMLWIAAGLVALTALTTGTIRTTPPSDGARDTPPV